MRPLTLALIVACAIANPLGAKLSVPNVFTDHMVLQRDQANPIWGSSTPNDDITVTLAGNVISTRADRDGSWRAKLPPLPAGGPHTLSIKGSDFIEINDVLVGEVWFCSGQSNMEWPLISSYGAEVEIAAANQPQIRLLSVERNGADTPQEDIDGVWQVCSPETAQHFSAIGYFYGKTLNDALDVPIGLIDNAWGGSMAESWIPLDTLAADERYAPLLEHWEERLANFDEEAYEAFLLEFKEWEAAGYPQPGLNWNNTVHPVTGQHRPANIYNGMVHPFTGYGIRGVIWYQGESNGGRADQYKHLFPLLVETWRDKWGQGDFPFYWVQLADYGSEANEPGENGWAELRDAQTSSMDLLANSGQAVIIDIGEGRDIHPRNKMTVANRLVRWPLAKDYGFDIAYQSPRYKSMELDGNKIRITFDHVSDQGLYSFDTTEIKGFSIASDDQNFVWAEAKMVDKNTVEVWSKEIEAPTAVRYGWAQNPVVNLYDRNGLPVTPFRTDSWKLQSDGKAID
ncbi:sialate O-acetylesterase [Pelagicoccus sp. SDUM812002]|uniref:sialate O-acetylesterase n=1 Tax=Pelagicoccus sp. SDUM812002 TaxID=3041266 RepID=UPI0028103F1D|nr:sialate O-acetylesterase [Pelagicoccus sp. SDUM812002]MDQ8187915.1 sialate O-acetylesterase [Pelagicoccus sp. SDUM812002]